MDYLTYLPYFIAFMFFLVELIVPLKRSEFLTGEDKKNIFFIACNHVLEGTVLISAFLFVPGMIHEYLIDNHWLIIITESGMIWQGLACLLLIDVTAFVTHYLLHRVPFLWKIHRVHHRSTNLNVLSSFRHSFLELGYHAFFLALIGSIVVVDSLAREIATSIFTIACYFQHANLKIKFPHSVNYFFITPKNHRWHHSLENKLRFGQNFGFVFPFWDILCKTYYVPRNNDCSEFGVKERGSASFLRELFFPF